jgi:hypothetical protein
LQEGRAQALGSTFPSASLCSLDSASHNSKNPEAVGEASRGNTCCQGHCLTKIFLSPLQADLFPRRCSGLSPKIAASLICSGAVKAHGIRESERGRFFMRQCVFATQPARGRVLPSSVIEVRAILLSPYCAELAGLKLQRFRFLPAFAACCCPFFLSEAGKPVFLEHPSSSSGLHRRSHRA